MKDAFAQAWRRLVPRGTPVAVGVSGGADSSCLLHLLAEMGEPVFPAHLHHSMRSEADEEMASLDAWVSRLGMTLITGRADVPAIAAARKIGLEEAGRHARYLFLRQVARQMDASLIATAHTRDDHLETVLFHVARGTGLAGLAGIQELGDGLVRPLLGFSREQTRAYCAERGLWFHDDPANEDLQFARARLRHRVVPEMRLVHPGFDESAVRLSRLAAEEDTFLDGAAAAALEAMEVPLNGELAFLTRNVECAVRRDQLAALPMVLRRRAIRLLFAMFGGSLSEAACSHAAVQVGLDGSGSVAAEAGELTGVWDADLFHVSPVSHETPSRHPLPSEGVLESVLGWQMDVRRVELSKIPARASLIAELDLQNVKGTLYVRGAAPGDKMQPLGFEGHRRLADLLSEAKLTPAARRALPIVCDMLGPVWAPNVCLSERVRPEIGTRSAISCTLSAVRGETERLR